MKKVDCSGTTIPENLICWFIGWESFGKDALDVNQRIGVDLQKQYSAETKEEYGIFSEGVKSAWMIQKTSSVYSAAQQENTTQKKEINIMERHIHPPPNWWPIH